MEQRNRRRRIIILLVAGILLALTTGVYATVPRGVDSIDVRTSGGEIISNELEVYLGSEVQLKCTAHPSVFAGRRAEYSCKDGDIAEIDQKGIIHTYKEGTTTVEVKCVDSIYTFTLSVEQPVEDIKLAEENLTLTVGEEYLLEPVVIMADENLDPPAVKYSVKRTTVARVDNNGLITAAGEGSTTIKVTAGTMTKKVKVTVKAASVVESTTASSSADQSTKKTKKTSTNKETKTEKNKDNKSNDSNNKDKNKKSDNNQSGKKSDNNTSGGKTDNGNGNNNTSGGNNEGNTSGGGNDTSHGDNQGNHDEDNTGGDTSESGVGDETTP